MSITAAEIMSHPVHTVLPQTTVGDIAALLVDHHISAVPVCEPDGTLVGLVSEADVIRPFRASAEEKRERWLTLLAEGEALSDAFLEHLRRDQRSASEVMSRQVATAAEGDTLPALAERMIDKGVRRLPVLRAGRVVGIVARADLIRALARAPMMTV